MSNVDNAVPTEETPTLNLNGKNYVISELPEQIQQQLALFQQFKGDQDKLNEERATIETELNGVAVELTKINLAVEALSAHINLAVSNWEASNAPVDATPTDTVVPVEGEVV